MARRPRPTIGDLFEIPLDTGVAYAQYSHEYPQLGSLLRVLPGIYPEALGEAALKQLVEGPERFFTGYVVDEALKDPPLIRRVASLEVPARVRDLPTMLSGYGDPETGEGPWYLLDGDQERCVEQLTPEMRELSPPEIIGHQVLVKRIATGWTPADGLREDARAYRAQAEARAQAQAQAPSREVPAADPETRVEVRFFAAFDEDAGAQAKACRADLAAQGYEVTLDGGEDEEWMLTVRAEVRLLDLSDVDERIEQIVEAHGGDFDGNEVKLPTG